VNDVGIIATTEVMEKTFAPLGSPWDGVYTKPVFRYFSTNKAKNIEIGSVYQPG